MKIVRVCAIEDCGAKHYGHGLCRIHYRKWRFLPENVVVSVELHGTASGYGRGCKCKPCRDAWNARCKGLRPKYQKRIHLYEAAQYAANKEERHARERKRILSRLDELNTIKLASGCTDCGYNVTAIALQFDHVRGKKEFNLSASHKYPRGRMLIELAKCEVVCANCHMIRTHSRRSK